MSGINSDVLDVDFRKCPEFVPGDLGVQTMLCGQTFEERFGVLSDREINEAIDAQEEAGGFLDLLVTRIFDQGQEGSCTFNAGAQAHQIVQAQQYGVDAVVQMSAISGYKQIGRTAQSGAFISDVWRALESTGFLPLDTPENRAVYGDHVMPNTGFSRPFPANWQHTAKKFCGLERTPITTLQGLKTAGLKHPVIVGRQGHAITYARLMRDRNGRHVWKYPNSWSQLWGDGGYGYDSESLIREAVQAAFALRAVRVER